MNLETQTTEQKPSLPYYGGEIFYPESDGKPMAETDVHAKLLMYLRESLAIYFENREDVYVTGNIMFYYVEGSPQEVVSPDIMVCFGVPKGDRTSYKTWEENDVVPSVIIELSSRSTWGKDRIEKKILYELLGVKEYYIFSPRIKKNEPILLAYKLENTEFVTVALKDNRIKSETLNLELVLKDGTLRLFDPKTKEFLKNTAELSNENEQLKAEIERLKKLLQK